MTYRRETQPIALAILLCAVTASTLHADLVGWWTFDDVVGFDVTDSSAFGNDGSLVGGATVSSDVPPLLAGGQSLLLGGGSQYVLIPDSDSLDIDRTESLTIAAWVKPVGNVGWDSIVAKNPSNGSSLNHAGNYELRIESGARRASFLFQRGGRNDTANPGWSRRIVPEGGWSHIAMTAVGGGDLMFYVNGVLSGVTALDSSFGVTNGNPLYIGGRADGFTPMNGLIDDLRIYDEVLSAQDIADLAGAVIPPPLPPGTEPLDVTIHSVSSNVAGFDRGAEHLVDGSGLDPVSGTHSTVPNGTMWLNQGTFSTGPPDTDSEIVFDLGQIVAVDRMKIWNYNETNPSVRGLTRRSIAKMDVLVSNDGVDFQLLIEDQLLGIAPGSATIDFSETVSLGGVRTRYVKFDNMMNHGGDNEHVGLSEVQFFAVPEPSGVALVMLGVLGLLLRRRR